MLILKDTFREIRRTFGRFMSILVIVALGCGFFTGLKATRPDMIVTASDYFVENRLMDLRLRSNIGVRSNEIAAVRSADNVEGAYAGYSKEVCYNYDNTSVVLKAISLIGNISEDSPNYLNKPELLEGRLPEKNNECAVEVKLSSPSSFKIGETLTLTSPGGSEAIYDTLCTDTFKIVGIVISPLYIGFEREAAAIGSGAVNSNIYIPEAAFTCNYYTDLYVKLKGTESLDPFSEGYRDTVKKLGKPAVEAFEASAAMRYESITASANGKIAAAQEKIAFAEQMLTYDRNRLMSLYEQALKAAVQIREEYGDSRNMIARAAVSSAEQKVEALDKLLNDKDGSVRAQYAEDLEDARAQMAAAMEELSALPPLRFYHEDRFSSNDYSGYRDDAEKVDNVSKAFPLFFVLIAALVCMTAMTRMVEEQRTVIGAYKAMGYTGRAILVKYLVYGMTAAVVGSIIGSLIGMKVFPLIIINTYKIMYCVPGAHTPVRSGLLIGAVAVSALLTAAAVVYTCLRELSDEPAYIMRPRPPKKGKRVFMERFPALWGRLSFLMKVTVRNLMRYKKRFIMTLVGVSGCTALIITGFGLKYSVSSIVDRQFGGVFTYSAIAALNTDEDEPWNALNDIKGVECYVPAISKSMTAAGEKESFSVNLIAFGGKPDKYIRLEAPDGKKLDPENGVLISRKLSKLLGAKPGDSIDITDPNGDLHSITIYGIVKNYALNYIYMSKPAYDETFGSEPFNVVILNIAEGADGSAVQQELIADKRIIGASFTKEQVSAFRRSIKTMDTITLVLIICAAFLSVTVLYNLADINITERRRELATIKVLGFFDGETGAYLYRENIISTIIGITAGLGLGKLLHLFVVATVEIEQVMFNRTLIWWAYLLGAGLTALFALLVNFLLYFKLKRIDMVESLKSVE
ncbi:MAG: ABC transporter permease [Ruminococcus sp.]|nr:ABC transporter permease [Ruminococcus sp.]